jgi:hypothetical protein
MIDLPGASLSVSVSPPINPGCGIDTNRIFYRELIVSEQELEILHDGN